MSFLAQRPNLLRAVLIIAAGFWIFAPALHGDWLMDDDFYIYQNPLLHDPHRLWKIWFAPGSMIEYYPIEATVQAVEWRLWHMNTLGYHLVNVALHVTSALLLWRLLEKFGLRFAWLGGLLFAVHPAVVESVAWMAELKNALSLPPFLLAMGFWIDFEREGRARDYLLSLGFFLLAMLCKISMALFPLVILLYAWWRRGRVSLRDGLRTIPFFVITFALGFTTVLVGKAYFQSHLQPGTNPDIGDAAARFALGGQTLAFYFAKSVLPVEMVPIYYQWPVHAASPLAYAPWLAFAAVLAFCWLRRATWGRHALLGLGFFAINLLPFLGLNSVTYMGFTWVMDHFLYVPIIGIIGLAVAALDAIDARLSPATRPLFAGALAIVFGALALESEMYAEQFSGPEKLWTYTLAHNPTSWLAHNNLGDVYLETGRTDEAIAQFQAALASNPGSVDAHTNLGFAYELEGRMDQAVAEYEEVFRYNPYYGITQMHLGHALEKMGRTDEAILHYETALRINPRDEATRAALARLKNRKPDAAPGAE